jgi:hypothetical protein
MIVYLVVAWIVYAFDRKLGKSCYRWWYDWSHEENLPQETVRGFICGRPGKTQCNMALILSILVTAGLATFSEGRSLSWFFTWIFGVIATVFGFVSGPLVMKLWGKREKVYETIDRLEAGEIKTPEAMEKVEKTLRSRMSAIGDWIYRIWNGPTKPIPPVVEWPTVSPDVPAPFEAPKDEGLSLDDLLSTEQPKAEDSSNSNGEGGDKPAGPKPVEELSDAEKIARFTRGG